jgi:membrane-associated protease RseP (regulator of RpoE activity)
MLVVVKMDSDSSFARDAGGKPGIQEGDAIVEVNGRRGTAEEVRNSLQQAVISSGSKNITINVQRRPSVLHVKLTSGNTSPQKLGVAVVIDKQNPDCLLVQSIRQEGMVPSWNASHPNLRVCPGDLIAEVNGISRDSAAMCKAIQTLGDRCELHLRLLTNDGGELGRLRRLPQMRHRVEAFPMLVMEPFSPTSSAGAASGWIDTSAALTGSYALKQTSLDRAEDSSSDASTGLPSARSVSPIRSVIDCPSG